MSVFAIHVMMLPVMICGLHAYRGLVLENYDGWENKLYMWLQTKCLEEVRQWQKAHKSRVTLSFNCT